MGSEDSDGEGNEAEEKEERPEEGRAKAGTKRETGVRAAIQRNKPPEAGTNKAHIHVKGVLRSSCAGIKGVKDSVASATNPSARKGTLPPRNPSFAAAMKFHGSPALVQQLP